MMLIDVNNLIVLNLHQNRKVTFPHINTPNSNRPLKK